MESRIYDDVIKLLESNDLLGSHYDVRSTNKFKPIRDILRKSWYVDKAVSYGFTKAIHIDLKGSFIAILDNDYLMSGSNCMISNAIDDILCSMSDNCSEISIYDELSCDIDNIFKSEIEEYEDDNSIIIFTFDELSDYINNIINYIDKKQ